MANTARGEFIIKLHDGNITLVPCYKNIVEVESKIGFGFLHIGLELSQCTLKIEQLAIFCEVFASEKNLGERIYDTGYIDVMAKCGEFSGKAIQGSPMGKSVGKGEKA